MMTTERMLEILKFLVLYLIRKRQMELRPNDPKETDRKIGNFMHAINDGAEVPEEKKITLGELKELVGCVLEWPK